MKRNKTTNKRRDLAQNPALDVNAMFLSSLLCTLRVFYFEEGRFSSRSHSNKMGS